MAALTRKIRAAILIFLGIGMGFGFGSLCGASGAQADPANSHETPSSIQAAGPDQRPIESGVAAAPSPDRPLPNVVAMMQDVETNQRKAESVEKDYIYHSVETEQEVDSHGHVKKITITESDHYWVDGVPIRRVVRKNGKPLTPEEMAKEDDRIKEIVAKAREKRDKADREGKETDPRGDDEITVSRFLALGAFSNARRVRLNGRDTIAVD
jgi:hypothetical protein